MVYSSRLSMKFNLLFVFLIASNVFLGQEYFPVNGTKNKEVVLDAFVNATIYIDYQTVVEDAALLIYQGKIVAVGKEVDIPVNAIVHDLKGQYIYPSFIDLYTQYGVPEISKEKWKPQPQYKTKKQGPYSWNQAIKPEINASEVWNVNAGSSKELRALGFGSALTWQHDGIAQGTSCLVSLGDNASESLLLSEAAAHYSLRKGSSRQAYPSSQMGVIALLKQTYLDAKWYTTENSDEKNLSLDAWVNTQKLPQIMDVKSKLEIFRADKIGDSNGVQYIFKGNGDEYQRINEIRKMGGAIILPINFPEAYDVTDPYLERLVSLRDMKHWELAPANPSILYRNGIDFAITSDGSSENFLVNLRKAYRYGLSESAALKALTYTPASLVRMEGKIGSLKKGMLANFIITSGNIFLEGEKIIENWVQGEKHVLENVNIVNLDGEYNLTLKNNSYSLKISGSPKKPKGVITQIQKSDTTEIKVSIVLTGQLISLNFNPKDAIAKKTIRLSGNVFKGSKIWQGRGQLPNGDWVDWIANRIEEEKEKQKPHEPISVPEMGETIFPLMAYGWEDLPVQETILIKNATLWTCEKEGVLEKSQILIHEGKIVAIEKSIDLEIVFGKKHEISPRIIDAYGKHISPGIIDEHSHIAINNGVNESGQASSAEVSIADVVNSDDINIYRQLAGGVTASQLLHGSANPIGGKSAMIKLRWGKIPEEMLVKNATPFIKFALGENVKQSNWGDFQRIRFPQTRMGVEQVYYDYFIQAREYDDAWNTYRGQLGSLTKKQIKNNLIPKPPRRDLELETLAQILNHNRFITCHSYQQGEINMLMHVADSMGFTLNTFTHILEGYKVADKMKIHGAGASTFADWWAYKFEVKDAIPYNAAMLYSMGITTAINSDDPEMGRRLNQEAAKTVKYGGVTEEEALKMVTLNPAILLHLDDRMGSLKVGKDADIVIWSDNPLSVYAKVEQTFVDGICYFSLEKDLEKRSYIKKERARLIQLMLEVKANGGKIQTPKKKEDKHYCCDTIEE